MEMLDEKLEREAEKIRRDLERRGIRVVDDPEVMSIDDSAEEVGSIAAFPNPAEEKAEPALAEASAPMLPGSGGTFTDTAAAKKNKFKGLYHYLLDSGLYITDSLELGFGLEREIALDEAGETPLRLYKEAYNASLTFTILTTLLQNTSMLAFGPPGSGKTTGAEFVISGMYNVKLSDIQEATILGNPELTEEKMLAYIDLAAFLEQKKVNIGVRKFITNPGRLIDEANRMSPSKTSLLMNALDRGWIIYNDKKIYLTPGVLFATVNGRDVANHELAPAFLDRFDIGAIVLEMNPEFTEFYTEKRNNKIRFVEDMIVTPPDKISERDIIDARKEVYSVQFDSGLINKMAHFLAELMTCEKAGKDPENKKKGNALYKKPGPLCKDCRCYNNDNNICKTTENSLSARTVATTYAFSKALAWWRGNSRVSEEDLRYAISYASWYKLVPTRQILEQDETFVNDRVALVKELWDISSRTYEEVSQVFPQYKTIVSTVTDYCRNRSKPSKSELLDMMESLKKIDSPAKIQVGVALKKMYQDYDRHR